MKKLLGVLSFLVLMSCATVSRTPITIQGIGSEPSPTSIDLDRYAPVSPPDPHAPLSLQAIPLDPNTAARQALIRAGRRYEAPFDGVCLNNEATAVVEATFNSTARSVQLDGWRSLAELRAQALRDLQLVQTDVRTYRAFYQAGLRSRDIAIEQANQAITTLTGTNNIWQLIGWSSASAVVSAILTVIAILIL